MKIVYVKLSERYFNREKIQYEVGFEVQSANVKNVTEKMVMLEKGESLNYSTRIDKSKLRVAFGTYDRRNNRSVDNLSSDVYRLCEDDQVEETISQCKQDVYAFCMKELGERNKQLQELTRKFMEFELDK